LRFDVAGVPRAIIHISTIRSSRSGSVWRM
jgi:hypothetical protein